MKHFNYILILILSCTHFFAKAQVVDDSTQEKYSEKTAKYFLEREIFLNKRKLNTPDTTVDGLHDRDDFLFSTNAPNKNLGNWGTALQPVFFALPKQIGINYGIDVFTPYNFDASAIRYFNTLSPYSYAHYHQGGFGRQMLRAGFNRNMSSRFNIGFDYQRITSQKQIGVTKNRDPQADHHALAIHANYVSKNGRYIFMGNYSHLNHFVYETGGVRPNVRDYVNGQLQKDSLFDFAIEQTNLYEGTSNRDLRNKWHIYQQYALDTNAKLQAFYWFERGKQTNRYQDPKTDSSQLYDLGSDTIRHTTQEQFYTLIEQKAGFKGQFSKKLDYILYYRRKDFKLTGNFPLRKGLSEENFVGAILRYQLNDSSALHTEGELQPQRDYRLKVEYSNKWAEIGAEQMRYAPTLMQSNYNGKHFAWDKPDFDFTTANNLWINGKIRYKKLEIKPFVSYMRLDKYIFFNQQVNPEQTNEAIGILTASTQLNITWKYWHFNHTFRYTKTNGADVIRMPDKFVHLRYYYQKKLFKKALLAQFGMDIRWRSAYFGDAYMPVVQQFYLQNDFAVTPYLVTDLFINAKIQRAKIFLKLNNVTQGIGSKGYFTVPFYPGQRRLFEFGLIWQFFD